MRERDRLTFSHGVSSGFPIFLGYFSCSIAFGLICRNEGFRLYEACLFSLTNFAGSGQFLAVNLILAKAALPELFISVLLINLRYLFMGMNVNSRLACDVTALRKIPIAFGTTDEIFSVAMFQGRTLTHQFMYGLAGISYLGWNLGTLTGFLLGMILPNALQLATGVTLYAMFSSILAQEIKSGGMKIALIAAISAIINSLLVIVIKLGAGWSFVISMLLASYIGSLIIPYDEKNDKETA